VFDAWVEEARTADILDTAESLGLKLREHTQFEHVGPCPQCGGDDRFSINTDKQTFNCRGCIKGGNVIGMVKLATRRNFADVCEYLTNKPNPRGDGRSSPAAPFVPRSPIILASTDDKKLREEERRQRIEKRKWLVSQWWRAGGALERTPGELYYAKRGIVLPYGVSGNVLRFHQLRWGDETILAIIGLFRNINGNDEPIGGCHHCDHRGRAKG